ncbi:D-hexose-6-phosphate mutarotase [Hydrogenophaga sp.]|uniref:D-hexose-6-phosphate mutarotase n=1 Tax=Hydrogenophaga sp. TaxID=1904254 RepID=UPI0025C5F833|nr:D-hexose-6-phosphate mutarotase [Hydrogenophaga sp.]
MASLEDLNATHGLGKALRVVAGASGGPVIEIHSANASARVALHGAQVLSFWPHGAKADLLFLSDRAVYQPGKAIRGGVPICWPWFGPDPARLDRPNHGFARITAWQLTRTEQFADGGIRVELVLRDTPDTRALWPHAFCLTLCVTVGQQLRLGLSTHNSGDTAFAITQALHSYLAVGDIAHTQLLGLGGTRYLDNAASAHGVEREQVGDVSFEDEVDRVYQAVPPELNLVDGRLQRRIHIRAEGSRTAVVWNPGDNVAARLSDLAPGDHRRFVCVETANAGDEVVTLAAGDIATITAVIAGLA